MSALNSWWRAYEVDLMTDYFEESHVWTWTVALNRGMFQNTCYFKMREEEAWRWVERVEQMNGRNVESLDYLEECYNYPVSMKWGRVLGSGEVGS